MEEKRYWYVFCQDELLLVLHDGQWTIPHGVEPPIPVQPWTTQITPATGYTAIAIDNPIPATETRKMMGLRMSYDVLSAEHYRTAGKCRELLFWHLNNKYCGCCGSPMRWDTPISKKCTGCGKELWPNVAVAIIVLIKKGDEVLLVSSNNFRGKFYGLVAGFVETGESLEESVLREVQEEVGLTIRNLRYVSSQPWPYPCGLMCGFVADYAGGEIKLQRSELAAGGWFNKENLPNLPQPLSIARKLINAWLEGKL